MRLEKVIINKDELFSKRKFVLFAYGFMAVYSMSFYMASCKEHWTCKYRKYTLKKYNLAIERVWLLLINLL